MGLGPLSHRTVPQLNNALLAGIDFNLYARRCMSARLASWGPRNGKGKELVGAEALSNPSRRGQWL